MINIKYSTLFVILCSISFNSIAIEMTPQRVKLKNLTLKNHKPLTSYTKARKYIMQKLHLTKDTWGYYVQDVYCNQRERATVGPDKMPPYSLLNVEHTWPQSKFNKSKNKRFQKADLHHLFPTNSVANSTRGNHSFGDVRYGDAVGSVGNIGKCLDAKFGILTGSDEIVFQPPREHRGNVARAMFYFSVRYDINIPKSEELILRRWDRLDPVDSKERARNIAISKIQGNTNPFIDKPYNVTLIRDF